MTFEVTILGSGAASPTEKRGNSAQLVNIHEQLNLIDCGEGTQLQMRRFGMKFQRISNIFISHLHGDHYLGLMGLMSSMHLLGRVKPLKIFGPKHLKELITLNLKYSETYLGYHWDYVELELTESEMIYEEQSFEVHAFPLKHRIQCHGFRFVEKKRGRKILKEAIGRFELGLEQIIAIKNGTPCQLPDGRTLSPDDVSEASPAPRSYAYCSDTAFSSKVIDFVRGSNVIYHEATFMEDLKDRAAATFHSTAAQAAQVALQAGAAGLVLGHFSTRYTNVRPLMDEAKAVFPSTIEAFDGLTIEI